MVVFVLKYGSYEGTELIDVFHTKQAAIDYAEKEGLTQDKGTGGYYVEEVTVKVGV